MMDKYVDALCLELESYKRVSPILVDTIFLGGGTPTLLGKERLKRLIEQIKKVFDIVPNSEFTVEMNPATADKELLSCLRVYGVNRISLGVQSFIDTELQVLGRAHTVQQAVEAIRLIKEAGYEQFNLDLMYAIPGQTKESYMSSIRRALTFSPAHLSLYSLILEEGTEFWERRNSLHFPVESEEMDMYFGAAQMLNDSGFSHYEISNYAIDNQVCRHNMKYWQLSPYVGVGPAAHSFFEGVRYANKADLIQYIKRPTAQKTLEEDTTRQILAEEYVMLGLRTSNGISISRYCELSGKSLVSGKENFIENCLKEEYIRLSGDNLCLTETGFYLSTAIIGEFLA